MSRKGRIKIPHTAFETFVNIARKDNGDTQELLCYFLGEKGKVDTMLTEVMPLVFPGAMMNKETNQ